MRDYRGLPSDVSPALMTFMVDRGPLEERGRAMGTFTLGADLGLSSGAVVLGFVVEATSFRAGFGVASLVAVAALLLFVYRGTSMCPSYVSAEGTCSASARNRRESARLSGHFRLGLAPTWPQEG